MSDVVRPMSVTASQIIATAETGQSVTLSCPLEICGQEGGWVELRGLSWRENLGRESLGVFDEYELDVDGRLLRLLRRYDFAAMAEFDLMHCVVDFELSHKNEPADVKIKMSEFKPDDAWWEKLPDATVTWLLAQIDAINLQDLQGQKALNEAKKKSES